MNRSITRTLIPFFLLTLALIAPSLSTPADALAQASKIGFVEPRIILERMPEMRAVQQRLQNFADRKRAELLEKETDLQNQIQAYQDRASLMNEDARGKEEQRLGELSAEFQQLQAQAEQELAQRRAEFMSPLLQQIQDAIDAVAAEKGLDIVLNTTTSTGDVIILYATEEIRTKNDITDAVMAKLEI